MKPPAKQLAELRRQLDASPWLKWALAAIAILAVVTIGRSLENLRASAQKQAIEAEIELRQIRSLQGQDVWLEREKTSAELQASVQARVPEAATPGMAQAALQGWLNHLATGLSADANARVNVEPAAAVEDMPGLLRVTGTLSAAMTPRQALNVLRQVEGATNLVLVESVDIRNDTVKLMSLRVNGYYRMPPGAAVETP